MPPRSAATAPFSKTFFCPPRCARRKPKSAPTSTRRSSWARSTSADADAAFGRLEYAGSVEEAAREADLVIEAVPEEMESKIEIFTLLDKILPPHHHPRLEYLFAEPHRNRQRHLPREEVRRHALLQSRAQNEAARNRARARNRRRHAGHRGRSRPAHGERSGGDQGIARASSPAASTP